MMSTTKGEEKGIVGAYSRVPSPPHRSEKHTRESNVLI